MVEMERKINAILAKIKQYFIGTEQLENKTTLKNKKRLNLLLLIAILVISILVLVLFLSTGQEEAKKEEEKEITQEHKTIELGAEATKGAVKWQNFLEEAIEEEGDKRQKQIEILKQTITSTAQATKDESQVELNELKSRLNYALDEINRLKTDNHNIINDLALLGGGDQVVQNPADLGITTVVPTINTKAPISTFNHILSTSFVTGYLVGGIEVSTALSTKENPLPISIKLTGRGNLPKKFALDIKQCRIRASCYGDISSERAVIRAEELVCTNEEAGLATITKVAGVVHGDDGANGIRGTVISMSEKHLKNAFIGGVVSGFSNTVKGQSPLNITALGTVSTQKMGIKEMAHEGLLSGATNAAETYANHNIKVAENISPVISIPGGTKVDVFFTHTVEVGSIDIEDIIKTARSTNHAK